MVALNSYLAYKRDTSRLIYWIVQASNAIISSSSAPADDAPIPNANGAVTVSGLVSLSKLIGKHITPAPSPILSLFNSVIQARSEYYQTFAQLVANSDKPDPETERSNAAHKHFIDALSEAFAALGGKEWLERQTSRAAEVDDQNNLEQVLFANQFAQLSLDPDTKVGEEDEGASGDDSGIERQPTQAPRRRQQKKASGKGKKGKHGKSSKKQPKQPAAPAAQSLDDVPMESYRIIQDEEGKVNDYLMAVYALVQEWAELRAYLQGVWRDVAYGGLNSAVAGAVSNFAVNMIERSAAAMFVDFPGHDSYEVVMNTITRGDPNKAQGMFRVGLHRVNPDIGFAQKVQEVAIDVREQFMIHAYQDLLDFVTDFQRGNRSGKPTKRMLKELGNWDPKLDLGRASEADRIRWRRCYTINWLYDLVNVFSSIVVQRNTLKGEGHLLESVDWSPDGPWDKHRRLYGLTRFAGMVTHLAMQKPGTDIRQKILPGLVFQLQCIVDSLAVSRGWSVSGLKGHVLTTPPRDFRPRRDVDLFLDRNNQRLGTGFLQGVDILKQFFEKDGALNGQPNRHELNYDLLEELQYNYINWLGESKYMYGLNTIPSSRFSSTNANGLWEFSPYLCGSGLAEALTEAYQYGFLILQRIPESTLLVHLHNALVQKGYIKKPIGLYTSFQELFSTAFFHGGKNPGKAPTEDFAEHLLVSLAGPQPVRTAYSALQGGPGRGESIAARVAKLKPKSFLVACTEAGWNPDRIPDKDIPMPSFLGSYRIMNAKVSVDPTTGKRRLEDSDLINRLKASGFPEEKILAMHTNFARESLRGPEIPEALLQALTPDGYSSSPPPQPGSMNGKEIAARDLLDGLKGDLFNDICGSIPRSSVNYVWVMARFLGQFQQFEEELARLRNPVYVQAYHTDPTWRQHKRVGLVHLALKTNNEECLRVMAEQFEVPVRASFMHHLYWEDLEELDSYRERATSKSDTEELSDRCVMM